MLRLRPYSRCDRECDLTIGMTCCLTARLLRQGWFETRPYMHHDPCATWPPFWLINFRVLERGRAAWLLHESYLCALARKLRALPEGGKLGE
jgi:hypothetical protein